MDIISASVVRLVAHMISFALAVAVIGALMAARGKSFNMRYWRLLALALAAYAVWFFMLALSVRDAELIRRGEVAWLFGGVELVASGLGWAWYVATMHASFYLARPGKQDDCHSGDKWKQNLGGNT